MRSHRAARCMSVSALRVITDADAGSSHFEDEDVPINFVSGLHRQQPSRPPAIRDQRLCRTLHPWLGHQGLDGGTRRCLSRWRRPTAFGRGSACAVGACGSRRVGRSILGDGFGHREPARHAARDPSCHDAASVVTPAVLTSRARTQKQPSAERVLVLTHPQMSACEPEMFARHCRDSAMTSVSRPRPAPPGTPIDRRTRADSSGS